jgi:drug/metabolite transporter (DMT)-like permease
VLSEFSMMTLRDLFLALLSLLVLVAGLITANLVFGEVLSARQWLGCGLVVVGLLLATLHLPTRSLLTPVKKTAMK